MNWNYLYLRPDGRLVYEDGSIAILSAPCFRSEEEADDWLIDNDIRATCAGRWDQ